MGHPEIINELGLVPYCTVLPINCLRKIIINCGLLFTMLFTRSNLYDQFIIDSHRLPNKNHQYEYRKINFIKVLI